MMLKHAKQYSILVGGFACICAILVVYAYRAINTGNHAQVVFLQVGQGDSILIKTSSNRTILIDGGPDNRVLDRLGRNMSLFDRSIDVVIATHPDADHIAGLVGVLGRYQIGLFLDPCVQHQSAVFAALEAEIRTRHIARTCVTHAMRFSFGEDEVLDIVYPFMSFAGQDIENNNDASVVARFSDGDITYLLTGDISVAIEDAILAAYPDLGQVTVLKAGHHGSDTSTGAAWLARLSPEAVVISAGRDNKYGHPHASVVQRIQDAGSIMLETALLGDIRFESDGSRVWLY